LSPEAIPRAPRKAARLRACCTSRLRPRAAVQDILAIDPITRRRSVSCCSALTHQFDRGRASRKRVSCAAVFRCLRGPPVDTCAYYAGWFAATAVGSTRSRSAGACIRSRRLLVLRDNGLLREGRTLRPAGNDDALLLGNLARDLYNPVCPSRTWLLPPRELSRP